MLDCKDNVFKYNVTFSALSIELISDTTQLLELNFTKKKTNNDNSQLTDPLKKALIYLDDYFSRKKNSIEIILNSEYSNSKVSDNTRKLFLNMKGYTVKEINVYSELLKVESGNKISYGDLAARSGILRGSRFAGNCMAANRFPVIIPCHRVIKADGSMGNYSGGVEIKEFLIKHEM